MSNLYAGKRVFEVQLEHRTYTGEHETLNVIAADIGSASKKALTLHRARMRKLKGSRVREWYVGNTSYECDLDG